MLVVKAVNENNKVSENKDEVSRAHSGVQIKNARFTTEGNIVMNFEDEDIRNLAAQKLETVSNVTTKSVKKMKLKIMICNAHKVETKETLIDTDSKEY